MEKCIKTMRPGERAKFLCMPEETEGYAQLESILRQETEDRRLAAKGLPPRRTHGCCAQYALSAATASPAERAADAARQRDLFLAAAGALELDIHLLAVDEPGAFTKQAWEMRPAERLRAAADHKDRGTTLFRAGNIRAAAAAYEQAIGLLDLLANSPAVTDPLRDRARAAARRTDRAAKRRADRARLRRAGKPVPDDLASDRDDVDDDDDGGAAEGAGKSTQDAAGAAEDAAVDPDAVLALLQTTRLNYAACMLRLAPGGGGDGSGGAANVDGGNGTTDTPAPSAAALADPLGACLHHCDEVLRRDPHCVRALLRRVQALVRIGRDLDRAAADLTAARAALAASDTKDAGAADQQQQQRPEWAELARWERELARKTRAAREKEKKMYAGISGWFDLLVDVTLLAWLQAKLGRQLTDDRKNGFCGLASLPVLFSNPRGDATGVVAEPAAATAKVDIYGIDVTDDPEAALNRKAFDAATGGEYIQDFPLRVHKVAGPHDVAFLQARRCGSSSSRLTIKETELLRWRPASELCAVRCEFCTADSAGRYYDWGKCSDSAGHDIGVLGRRCATEACARWVLEKVALRCRSDATDLTEVSWFTVASRPIEDFNHHAYVLAIHLKTQRLLGVVIW
ncbi:hypothetical protein HK405_009861 [Cladochytrium tenue]|nr:hypothetical protein HK405_009861 [Cladochytrium tenue]